MTHSQEKASAPHVVRASPEDLDALRAICTSQFAQYMSDLSNSLVLSMSTSDGRQLAIQSRATLKADRVGALVSSLLAVAETSCREFGAGRCLQTIVVAEHQQILVLRVGNARSPFVLAGAYDNKILLGSIYRLQNDLGLALAQAFGQRFPFIVEP
ncbi:roadblock/LC7 domain-containing protein [Ahniella affigens]|nr:roadblock/LC7 domain-containing protein [Ahniella affigens]